jgi:hypothetical protein
MFFKTGKIRGPKHQSSESTKSPKGPKGPQHQKKESTNAKSTTLLQSERTQGFTADPVYGRAKCLPMLGEIKT